MSTNYISGHLVQTNIILITYNDNGFLLSNSNNKTNHYKAITYILPLNH